MSAADSSAENGAPRVVRVQVVFHVSSDEQAQAVASRMVDRAHEIANLPECECDLDVSIQRAPADTTSFAEAGSAPAHGHPAKL